MAEVTRAFAGSSNLAELQQVIQDYEDIQGVLLRITVSGSDNLLAFNAGVKSDKDITLEVFTSKEHPDKPNTTFVWSGPALVGGSQQSVAAYRSN
jgi:hypothetical protein